MTRNNNTEWIPKPPPTVCWDRDKIKDVNAPSHAGHASSLSAGMNPEWLQLFDLSNHGQVAGQKADTTSEEGVGGGGSCLCPSGASELAAREAMIWQVHIVRARWPIDCEDYGKNVIPKGRRRSCSRTLWIKIDQRYSFVSLQLLCGWNNTERVYACPLDRDGKRKAQLREEWIMQDGKVPLTEHISSSEH